MKGKQDLRRNSKLISLWNTFRTNRCGLGYRKGAGIFYKLDVIKVASSTSMYLDKSWKHKLHTRKDSDIHVDS